MAVLQQKSDRPLRIAVADDEPFMRRYLQKVLPSLGHEIVAVAGTGRELVDQCRQTQPDLVITDVNMPEMDGLEAVTAIYEDQPMPIIVISGHHGPELIERTMAAHVMAFLVKPIKVSDIDPVISQALRRFARLHAPVTETADSSEPGDQATPADLSLLVDRAVQALIRSGHLAEHEARAKLDQWARARNVDLSKIAQAVVLADEALVTAGHIKTAGEQMQP